MSKKKSGKGSALKRPVKISTKLAAIIGKGPMPRTDVIKKLWAYIKKHKLQHPTNRRCIKIDAKLATILKPSKSTVKMGRQTIKVPAGHIFMIDMTKQLNKQIESASVKVNPSASRYEEDEYDVYSNPEDEYDDQDEYEEDEDEDEDDDDDDYEYEEDEDEDDDY